jgi:hypothetical protein
VSVTGPAQGRELVPFVDDWQPLELEPPKAFTEDDYEALRAERYAHPEGMEWGTHGRRLPRMDSPQMTRLLAAIEAGHFIAHAALYAGLGRRTVHRWLERGEQDAEDELDTPYRRIWLAIGTAKVIATHRMLSVITAASHRGAWRAAAWFLERSNPRHWGRNSIGHDGEYREWLESQQRQITPEELNAKIMAILGEGNDSEDIPS